MVPGHLVLSRSLSRTRSILRRRVDSGRQGGAPAAASSLKPIDRISSLRVPDESSAGDVTDKSLRYRVRDAVERSTDVNPYAVEPTSGPDVTEVPLEGASPDAGEP